MIRILVLVLNIRDSMGFSTLIGWGVFFLVKLFSRLNREEGGWALSYSVMVLLIILSLGAGMSQFYIYENHVFAAMHNQKRIDYIAEAAVEHAMAEVRGRIREKNVSDPVRTSDMVLNGLGKLEWSAAKRTFLRQTDLDDIRATWDSSPPSLDGSTYQLAALELLDDSDNPLVSAVVPYPRLTTVVKIRGEVRAVNGISGLESGVGFLQKFVVYLEPDVGGQWRYRVRAVKDS